MEQAAQRLWPVQTGISTRDAPTSPRAASTAACSRDPAEPTPTPSVTHLSGGTVAPARGPEHPARKNRRLNARPSFCGARASAAASSRASPGRLAARTSRRDASRARRRQACPTRTLDKARQVTSRGRRPATPAPVAPRYAPPRAGRSHRGRRQGGRYERVVATAIAIPWRSAQRSSQRRARSTSAIAIAARAPPPRRPPAAPIPIPSAAGAWRRLGTVPCLVGRGAWRRRAPLARDGLPPRRHRRHRYRRHPRVSELLADRRQQSGGRELHLPRRPA